MDGGTGWAPAQLLPKDQKFLPFKKAMPHASSLKLKNLKEWEVWYKSGA